MAESSLYPKGKEKQVKTFLTEMLILHKMHSQAVEFSVLLEMEDTPLQPVFRRLLRDDYVEIFRQSFAVTQKGMRLANFFKSCYLDYLKNYDVYCAVDLGEGVFAFEDVDKFKNDTKEWQSYLHQERFEDLRIAVAEYLHILPSILLFVVYLKEKRFSKNMKQSGWQFDLMLGTFWNDMEKVYESSIKIKQLAYQTENGDKIDGEAVITDIIRQGQKLNSVLQKDYLSLPLTPKNRDLCWDELISELEKTS